MDGLGRDVVLEVPVTGVLDLPGVEVPARVDKDTQIAPEARVFKLDEAEVSIILSGLLCHEYALRRQHAWHEGVQSGLRHEPGMHVGIEALYYQSMLISGYFDSEERHLCDVVYHDRDAPSIEREEYRVVDVAGKEDGNKAPIWIRAVVARVIDVEPVLANLLVVVPAVCSVEEEREDANLVHVPAMLRWEVAWSEFGGDEL